MAVSFIEIAAKAHSCVSLGLTCLPQVALHWILKAPSSARLMHLSFLSRSIFKPFIFVDDVKLVPKAQSPCFGDDDPAKKEPRFQEKPDRRHELYKAHEWARAVIESDQVSLEELQGGRCQEGGREAAGTHIPLLFFLRKRRQVLTFLSILLKPNQIKPLLLWLP